MTEGAKLFAETEWQNGFNVLCDYRKITEFHLDTEDIRTVVDQDKKHEYLFDQSKCAIVGKNDLIFGYARMWEIFSQDTDIDIMVFRDINEAIIWLEMDIGFLSTMEN